MASGDDKKRIDADFAVILADNDQCIEHGRAWFRQATNADLMRVWQAIQREYKDPALEVMSRMAQIKFCELLAEKFASPSSE